MELAEISPEMIMLQDWDASGYGLPDQLICDLFERIEAFRCLKIETVPAGIKYSRILSLTEGRLNVSGGWAVTQTSTWIFRFTSLSDYYTGRDSTRLTWFVIRFCHSIRFISKLQIN